MTAAEQTRVEYANGHLTGEGTERLAPVGPHRGGESIDVAISLPAGSRVHAEAGVAALHATGRLGECRAKVGVGDVSLDEVGALNLKTGAGDVTVDRVAGKAEVVTGSGGVRIGRIEGTAG